MLLAVPQTYVCCLCFLEHTFFAWDRLSSSSSLLWQPHSPSEAAQMSPSEDSTEPSWYIPQANCWLPPPPPICAPTRPQLCLDGGPGHGNLFYMSSCPLTPTRSWMIDFRVAIINLPVAQTVKNLPARQETKVWSLGWKVPLEKGMAIYSTILAWRIPWQRTLAGYKFLGSQRVWHDWVTNTVHRSWMTQRTRFIFYSSLYSHCLA